MTSLRAALRAATHTAHEALEFTMAMHPSTLTVHHYGRIIRVLHAVRAAWDPALDTLLLQPPGPHLAWLEADLQVLKLTPLQPAPPLPLGSAAQAWGVRYVLEGSALGGRSLLRVLAPHGLGPDHGARYFAGRGAETAAHWSAFLACLEAQANNLTTPSIIAAAQTAFTVFEQEAKRHLTKESSPETGS